MASADDKGRAQDAYGLRNDLAAALSALDRVRATLAALPVAMAQEERAAHERSATALAQALRAALPQSPVLQMEDARLTRLLQLAGPLHAAELLAQLDTDLAGVAQALDLALDPALPQPDFDAIRRQTHVLIAVAGSVGAVGLEAAARALNRMAHDPEAGFDPAAAQDLRSGVDALRHLIAARGRPQGQGL